MHIMSIRSPLCQAVKEHYITRYHRIFKIMDKLGVIEEQPHKENIKKAFACD